MEDVVMRLHHRSPPFLAPKKKILKKKDYMHKIPPQSKIVTKEKRKQCDKVGGLQVQKMSTMRKLGGGLGA